MQHFGQLVAGRRIGVIMKVRLKDIAVRLNVSVNTVSRALRGGKDIGEATRRRVAELARQMDYQPNLMARSLVTGKSSILGLIVPDLLNPFYAELAKSISRTLSQHSKSLILASSEEDPETERREAQAMLARGVEALLIASCQPRMHAFYRENSRIAPIVLVDRPIPHLRANFVGSDDYAGGKMATEHLIQTGRKRIAYIGSPDLSPGANRFRGFRHTMRDHNLKIHNELVLPSPLQDHYSDDLGYQMMQRILKGRTRPDGVFCHNDAIAIGAMRAALDAGFRVPEDIAVVGFDNVRYSRYLHIPLTSVDQRAAELGEVAAELAIDASAQKKRSPRQILLTPTLVVRQSTVDGAPWSEVQNAAIKDPSRSSRRKLSHAGSHLPERNRRGDGLKRTQTLS